MSMYARAMPGTLVLVIEIWRFARSKRIERPWSGCSSGGALIRRRLLGDESWFCCALSALLVPYLSGSSQIILPWHHTWNLRHLLRTVDAEVDITLTVLN